MGYSFERYDVDKFEDGEWAEMGGGRFKIARMGNPRYRDALRRLEKQYRKQQDDDLTAEQQDEMHAEAMAIGLLTDWADITKRGKDGEPEQVPYSVENAKALLLRDPKLVQFVANKSTNLERFETEEAQTQAKKPPKRSSTG